MSCQNCGASELELLFTAPAFDAPFMKSRIERCRNCQLVNTEAVSSDELARAYSVDYYGSPEQKFNPILEKIIGWLHRRQAKKLLGIWSRGRTSVAAPRVMDIGCGRGLLLSAFQKMGAEVHGLERPELEIAPAMRNIVKIGAITDATYINQHFDVVVLWHVLEHLHNTLEHIQHLSEHLREGGVLVLSVPNFDSLQRRLFGRAWFHLDVPRHLFHIESSWLLSTLEQQGYKSEDEPHFDFTQTIFGFVQSAMNVIAPQRANEFYRLLKQGRRGNLLRLFGWSATSLLLLPIAVLESMYSVAVKQGATVTVVARREKP
jgi:2-polyprenyl-3-methyl-5-hydroxy-6-metoxy-1,4-benzoquinol methylase